MKSYKGFCKSSIYEHLGIWVARFDNNVHSDDTTEDMILVLEPGTLEFLSQDDVSNVLSSFENLILIIRPRRELNMEKN